MTNSSNTNLTRSDWVQVYKRSGLPVTQELDCELQVTEGSVPSGLNGTLYRNGPGRFGVGNHQYSHPFDGDGMVSRISFKNGRVSYRNSYVKTQEFLAEEASNQMLFRAFGSNRPGGLAKNILRMKFKNAANTNVVSHGGRLLALWEGGLPHAIDPETLRTLSRFDYSGRLKNPFGWIDRRMNPELAFSAHPKVDPKTGILYNFGLILGVKNRLMLYQVGPDGEMCPHRFFEIGALSFIHDFVITSNSKAIFFCSPVSFDISSMLLGRKSPASGIAGDPTASVRVMVFDLNGPPGEIKPSSVDIYEAPYSFVFHHINAFEDEGGIHIYSSEMKSFPTAPSAQQSLFSGEMDYPATQLVHYRLIPGVKNVVRETLDYGHFELPRVQDERLGIDFESFYAIGVQDLEQFPFMDEIQKVTKSGTIAARFRMGRGLAGEPVFCRALGKGYLLSVCYNDEIQKSELIILDEADLKLRARLPLPHSQPLGFHGNWVPSSSAELS